MSTANGPYKQMIPDLQLSIEKDTENVPNDGKFYVIKESNVLSSYRSLKQAQELFKRVVAESGYKPKEQHGQMKSASERAHERYMEAKDLYWADSYRYRGRGGKGGRGGV